MKSDASKINITLLNYTRVNTSIEERGTGSISPSEGDVYILNNAILLDSDNVLLTTDEKPIVYNT